MYYLQVILSYYVREPLNILLGNAYSYHVNATNHHSEVSMDIRDILAQRGQTHGHYPNHAAITQHMKDWFRAQHNWAALSNAQKETLDMIAHKIGRVLAGDPTHVDHYKDISGYAELCVQELESNTAAANAYNPEPQRRDYSKNTLLRNYAERLNAKVVDVTTPAEAAE